MFTSEKRTYNRCGLIGSGLVNDTIKFSILDISAVGMRLLAESPLKDGEHIKIDFRINNQLNTLHDKEMHLDARVIRNSSFEGEPVHEYAIEYENISELNKIVLDDIIELSCGTITGLCEKDECSYNLFSEHHIGKHRKVSI